MLFLTDLSDAKEYLGPSAVALGNFDGVHKGHQALIRRCVSYAKENGLSSVVFTFLNHPANEIAGKRVVKSIMTLREKAEAVEAMGADALVAIPFTENVMKSTPFEFAKDILSEALHAKHAVCGFNYSFAFKGMGTPETLTELGKELGYSVSIIDEIDIDGLAVSSTLIRKRLAEGDVEAFEKLCGRRYSLSGTVVKGEMFGRTMGFPTVNLSLSIDMALPLNGVYITVIYVDGVKYHSVTNVGNKPSVGQFSKNAETHIFGFSGDAYGKHIKVEFIKLLRKERRFENTNQLCAQIAGDCRNAMAYFSEGQPE